MTLRQLSPDPMVGIVIPARDAVGSLEAAVRSALAQQVPGELQVVIAAAESPPGTLELATRLAADHPSVSVVANPDGTTPAALNRAIAACAEDVEVVVRLDAHAVLPPDYARRAVEVLRETGAANVGGLQRPVASGGFASGVAAAMTSPLGAGGARYRTGGDPGDVETVYLGVFHRDALRHVGGYDERLIRNQDFELNHRLRGAGGRVYFHPDLAVDYQPRATVGALARQYYDYGRWKRWVVGLHPDSVRARQLAPPALVVGLVGATALGARARSWPRTLLPTAGYLAALGVGTLVETRTPRRVPRMTLALAVMHLSWGIGFLRGGIRLDRPRPPVPPRQGRDVEDH